MSVGVQAATFSILICIIISYFSQRRLALLSTRFFKALMFSSLITVTLELFSIASIVNDSFPEFSKVIFYKLLLIGLNSQFVLLFLYIRAKVYDERRMSVLFKVLSLLPFVGFTIGAMVMSSDFMNDAAIGHDVYPIYLSAIVYIGLGLGIIFKKYKAIPHEVKYSLLLGVVFWLIFTSIEFVYPLANLTSASSLCVIFFIYAFIENPRDYRVHEIDGAYNKNAFVKAIDELIAREKPFKVVEICLASDLMLKDMYNELVSFIKKLKNFRVFYVLDYTFCLILDKDKDLEYLMQFDGMNVLDSKNFMFDIPAVAKNKTEVLSLIESVKTNASIIENRYIGTDYVERKNYEEKVLQILRDAIDNDGIYMVYQPIYSTKDKKFTSTEALVRLKDDKTIGFIPPDVFIGLAERNGLIIKLSNIIFENVCRFFSENNLQELGIHYVEVNVSSIQGVDRGFSRDYLEIMKKYDIDPKYINLEITETASAIDSSMMRRNMDNLRNTGTRFSLDDFGTGYSSIRKMIEMKFELVKLDKSLLWPAFGFKCNADNEAMAVLNETIKMVKSIKAQVVVEGCETLEMVDFLHDNNVEFIQGFYYSKPLKGDDFISFIKERNFEGSVIQ